MQITSDIGIAKNKRRAQWLKEQEEKKEAASKDEEEKDKEGEKKDDEEKEDEEPSEPKEDPVDPEELKVRTHIHRSPLVPLTQPCRR